MRKPNEYHVDHKRTRVTMSNWAMLRRDPKEFLRRFVTVDMTYIPHYTPETKEHSKRWISGGKRAQKKAKTVLSEGKEIASVILGGTRCNPSWLPAEKKTINGEYFAPVLNDFNDAITHSSRKKVLSPQDNARVHTCAVAMTKSHEFKYELLTIKQINQIWPSATIFCFQTWRNRSAKNSPQEEVIAENTTYFEWLEKSFFFNG